MESEFALPCYSILKLCCLADTHFFLISKFIYLFICLFVYLFLAVLGLRCCAWAFSSCGERGYSSLRCMGFSLRWLLLLQSTGSRHAGFSSGGSWAQQCGSWALERRLSSCGTQAQLLHGLWDLLRPGLKPMSPALAGGFLTTAPPRKSHIHTQNCCLPDELTTLSLYNEFLYPW